MSFPAKPSKTGCPKLVPRPTATSKARANKALPPVKLTSAAGAAGAEGAAGAGSTKCSGSPPARRAAFGSTSARPQAVTTENKFRPQSAPKTIVSKQDEKQVQRHLNSSSAASEYGSARVKHDKTIALAQDLIGSEKSKVSMTQQGMLVGDSTRPSSPEPFPQDIPTRDENPASFIDQEKSRYNQAYKIHEKQVASNRIALKDAFNEKQKIFKQMKKELDLKQQDILELHTSLKELAKEAGEQVTIEGECGEGGERMVDFAIFHVAEWTDEELPQICRNFGYGSAAGEFLACKQQTDTDDNLLAELNFKLTDLPGNIANVCLQALTNRKDLLNYARSIVGQHEEEMSEESIVKLNNFYEEGQDLVEMLNGIKSKAEADVEAALDLAKRAWSERGALAAAGESLVREVARLGARIDEMEQQPAVAASPADEEFGELSRMLEEERSKRATLADRLVSTESQLRNTRARLTKMEKQLKESDVSLAELKGTIKTLEDQKQKSDVKFEARARKLRESMKTGELVIGQISQEREVLEDKIKELTDQIASITKQHEEKVVQLQSEISNLESRLEEQIKACDDQAKLKTLAEEAVASANATIEELRLKIEELEQKIPNPDVPTQHEIELWAELQATKDTLHMTEEEVNASRREKIRFLESMANIADNDNKVTMQQKLAAELLAKEELLAKIQNQNREMTKCCKLNEQKVNLYEQHIKDMLLYNATVVDNNGHVASISQQELQNEIMSLRMHLVEVSHHNEELTQELLQKEAALEAQDKTARGQLKVIKVREELINMLKNKETEQSKELEHLQTDLEHRMKIVDEVNKQIAAKADEIQQLFTSLESKQQHIHRLEKIVLALEEQQRRAQAQRTRHEEKIAALEHELVGSGGARRRTNDKKYLFF